MTAKNNFAFKVRIGAAHDEVTVADRRTGKSEVYDRAAMASYDAKRGLKPWQGDRAKLNELVADAWSEDRGVRRGARADKRARDQKHKQRRQRREG